MIFEYLEKYLGTPELRPLWECKSEKHLSVFNIELAGMEKSGPFLEQDIAKIAEALKTHNFYSAPFLQAITEVHQDIMDRNPTIQLHKSWQAALQKTEEEYHHWYDGLTDAEQCLVSDWMARYLIAKAMECPHPQS